MGRQQVRERGDHVRVRLGAGHPAHAEPGERVAQAEVGADPGARRRVGPELVEVDAVADQADAVAWRGPAARGDLDRVLAHGRRAVGEPVGQAIGEVAPLAALVGRVDAGHDHPGARDRPHDPGQQVRVDHEAVEHVGPEVAHQADQPCEAARVRHAGPHPEAVDGDALRAQGRLVVGQRDHRHDHDVPAAPPEAPGEVARLLLGPADAHRRRQVHDPRWPPPVARHARVVVPRAGAESCAPSRAWSRGSDITAVTVYPALPSGPLRGSSGHRRIERRPRRRRAIGTAPS